MYPIRPFDASSTRLRCPSIHSRLRRRSSAGQRLDEDLPGALGRRLVVDRELDRLVGQPGEGPPGGLGRGREGARSPRGHNRRP